MRPGSARGMDVLLITLDTTRADHLGCYGRHPSNTPTLDKLCAQGIRFDNAVTSTPVTLPAHASILTGLLPNHHGARYNGEFKLDPKYPVLTEELKAAGYQTAAFVSSFVLERRFGLDRGFDTYDDHVEALSSRRGSISRNERDAEAVTDAVLAYLRERDFGKPLMLWVHYYDAHAPYAPRMQPSTSASKDAYAAEIGDVDRALGRLLDSAGLDLENTVIVVAADHGEGLGEHEERTHGLFLYESTTRVPLILRVPDGLLDRSSESGLAALIDIRPSLLSLLGIESAGPADGIDWLSRRRGPHEGVYQEASMPYFDFGFAPEYAWRTANDHFIGGSSPELYALSEDPGEHVNRALEIDVSRADFLRQRLDAVMLDGPDIIEAASHREEADPDTLARLRSLGYLGGAAPESGAHLPDTRTRIRAIDLFQDAIIDRDTGKPLQALGRLTRADALSPRNLSILRLQANIELQLGRYDSAEKTLTGVLAIKRDAASLVLLAQIRILRADYVGASDLLDAAERLDGDSGGGWIARGDIAHRQGDIAGAEAAYRKAQDLDPDRLGPMARGRIENLQLKQDNDRESALK